MENIKWIGKHGKMARGKQEFIRYLEGGKNTLRQAVYGMCYQCTGYYSDSKRDCQAECPLHDWMPFREDKTKVKTARSEKQKENDRKLSLIRSTGKQNKGLQEF